MQDTESEKYRKQWVNYVAKQLAKEVPESDIANALIRRGYNKQQAQEFVRYVATHELETMSKAGKRAAPKEIIFGSLVLIGGVVMTVASFTSDSIPFYVICYGAIIGGLGLLARGIWKMRW